MGLFDLFKKENEKENDAEAVSEEINTDGWDAITETFNKLYPDQKNPLHYAAMIKWRFGGNDPLDGISIYDGGDYWHFVTYGLSELHEKVIENTEYSGYGMEFTLKLKKDNYADEEAELKGICGILQTIARATFSSGEIFRPYEYLYTGQTEGMDVNKKSNITGFITISDEKAGIIDTVNGKVEFIQFIGVTDNELKAIQNKETTVKELYEKLNSDVTNYNRKSVF